MEKKTDICENCIDFIQHYIKLSVRFKRLNSGHCRRKPAKWIWTDHSCPKFKKRDAAPEDERQTSEIACLIKRIAKELRKIKQVLKDS